jgi:hypothetical protein
MKLKLAFALLPLILLGPPIYAQSLCVECLKAAKEELKKCLDAAISQEDKTSCAQKQETRASACENGQCIIERVQSRDTSDVLPPKKK